MITPETYSRPPIYAFAAHSFTGSIEYMYSYIDDPPAERLAYEGRKKGIMQREY